MPLLFSADAEKRKIFIVGQGLAGSILAFVLDERGYDVQIIDDGLLSSSSKVAAGMWNPVSFKNLHESWLAHKVIPAAGDFYRAIETKFNINVFHEVELIRLFPDVRAANDWDQRSMHPELSSFLTNLQDSVFAKEFHQPFGHGVTAGAGWLNILPFLTAIREYFISKGKFILAEYTPQLENELLASHQIVIQCTGWRKLNNALHWIPVSPNKGQVLTLRIPHLNTQRMVNFGKFIVPVGEEIFRLGATFELNPESIEPTQEGCDELKNAMKDVCDLDFEVVEHLAGFRPTLPDRMPVMGMDEDVPNKGIFNGFGSKGVMMIPFFATHFANHLIGAESLMKEVDLKRFIKKYKSSGNP